jgi:alkanesulfonate monooxygenase SsuD/methylene tetrahydromethanopterin reductase-like flavin-dependent oxidoreductase (luciferase family)
VVARHADIWNCPNNHATELPRRLAVLREHCAAAGRHPEEIEVSEQCVVVLGRDDAHFAAQWAAANRVLGRVFDLEKTAYRGTPESVVEQLRKRVAEGVTFFTFLLSDFHALESLALFAETILPAFADGGRRS